MVTVGRGGVVRGRRGGAVERGHDHRGDVGSARGGGRRWAHQIVGVDAHAHVV